MRLHRWTDLAERLSRLSTVKQHKLGAVIVKGNRILGVGCNSNRTHPRAMGHMRGIHAELKAIINARSSIQGAEIIVGRYHKRTQVPALARPCENCEQLLKEAGIIGAYYSSEGGYCYEKY